MRILLVAPPWVAVPPHTYGGTEAVVDTLARGLQAAGHDVLLYTTGDSTCSVNRRWTYERAVGTENNGTAAEIRQVVDAYNRARDWDADVVHDHTIIGPLYGLHVGAPVVTTNHGPFDEEFGTYYEAIAGAVPIIA